jgi:hypothetical protein
MLRNPYIVQGEYSGVTVGSIVRRRSDRNVSPRGVEVQEKRHNKDVMREHQVVPHHPHEFPRSRAVSLFHIHPEIHPENVEHHLHNFPKNREINSIHIQPAMMTKLNELKSKIISETRSQQNQGSGNERVHPTKTLLIEDVTHEQEKHHNPEKHQNPDRIVSKVLAYREHVETLADREIAGAVAEIVQEMDRLQTENVGYRGAIETLEEEKAQILNYYRETHVQIVQPQKEKIETLEQENENLQSRSNVIWKQLGATEAKYKDIDTLYAKLLTDYAKLKEDNTRLQVKIQAAAKMQQLQAARRKGGGGGGERRRRGQPHAGV